MFREGCEKLSIPLKKLSINTKGCQAQGFCNLGCTAGAKQGTLEVQIPQALSRGVEIVYNAYVENISPNAVNFSVRTAPPSTKANTVREGNYTIRAEAIVVAAGSLNTPPLLLRSEGALRLRNDNVGRYLTLHPAVNVNGIHREKIKNYRGFPKLWFVDEFSDSQGFFLETSFYYPGITAKNNPHFGLEHQTLMDDYSKMMSILVLVHDHEEKENRVRVDSTGAPVVEYRVSKESRASLIRAIRKSAEIFFAAGCEKVALPASKKNVLTASDLPDIENLVQEKYLKMQKSPLSSAHPMGGARMGADRNTAVTQPDGSLYGCPTVWIADASLFPTSSHVNPYETVMLLASRVAENTLRSLGAAK